MSVIENALRKAQSRQQIVADDAPATPLRDRRKTTMTRKPGVSKSVPRRRVSPATFLLLALAVVTFVVITKPGWGEGFQPVVELAQVPDGAAKSSAKRVNAMALSGTPVEGKSTPVELQPETSILGPEVDLSDVLEANPANRADTPSESAVISSAPAASRESASSVLSRFRLEGVMMSGSSRMAIVNGAIVQEGQGVGDATVTAITRSAITVEVNGNSYHIPLGGK